MKKISKVLMLLVVVVLGGLVLASCSYKGKSYKYDSYKVSDSLQSYADSLGANAFEYFIQNISGNFGVIDFSKNGKEVTVSPLIDPEDEDPGFYLNETYPVLVIGKKIYVDENLDGVIDELEANQYFQVKGSKLILHLDLDSFFTGQNFLGSSLKNVWIEITFKKV